MSAVATPTVELTVTENAAEEIKKFFAGEEDLTDSAGLRVRVVPADARVFSTASISKKNRNLATSSLKSTGSNFSLICSQHST
jgi:hypothetical protein